MGWGGLEWGGGWQWGLLRWEEGANDGWPCTITMRTIVNNVSILLLLLLPATLAVVDVAVVCRMGRTEGVGNGVCWGGGGRWGGETAPHHHHSSHRQQNEHLVLAVEVAIVCCRCCCFGGRRWGGGGGETFGNGVHANHQRDHLVIAVDVAVVCWRGLGWGLAMVYCRGGGGGEGGVQTMHCPHNLTMRAIVNGVNNVNNVSILFLLSLLLSCVRVGRRGGGDWQWGLFG